MNRRGILAALGTAVAGTAAAVSIASSEEQPGYRGEEPVIYEHDGLEIEILQDSIEIGDVIDVRVTNEGDSLISLGCGNPWALQRQENGRWHHVAWTGTRYYRLCFSGLPPGETYSERITLTEAELGIPADEYSRSLTEGKHRIVFLGPSPFVAQQFHVGGSGTKHNAYL